MDFDGEDARNAAGTTRVVAAVMDEIADSGDTFDFLGGRIDVYSSPGTHM